MKPLFSDREIRAAAIFLPLALLTVAALALLRAKPDPDIARQAENEMETRTPAPCPEPFDPNTADFEQLLRLGLTRSEAAALLNYRAAGKIFRIPEHLADCRAIDDSVYRSLRPYIRIGQRFAAAPRDFRSGRFISRPLPLTTFRIDTVTARYLQAIGAFSRKQAQNIIKWRELHGIYCLDDLLECYSVNDSVACVLAPYLIYPERPRPVPQFPIEINSADSAALRAVDGIGKKTVVRILEYRRKLGGFVDIRQLAEIEGMTESNFEKISAQIYCDTCKIHKIDINFALPSAMESHPYLDRGAIRKLMKARQLKGGWSTAEEFRNANILSPESAERLIPYLCFGSRSGSDDRHKVFQGRAEEARTLPDTAAEQQVPSPADPPEQTIRPGS